MTRPGVCPIRQKVSRNSAVVGTSLLQLVVVNPSQFKVISMSTKKTDRHDAKVLAEFLEKDMLPEVRMKDDLQAKISSLTQTREKLVQLRTVLKNKVNNLLAANFIVLK